MEQGLFWPWQPHTAPASPFKWFLLSTQVCRFLTWANHYPTKHLQEPSCRSKILCVNLSFPDLWPMDLSWSGHLELCYISSTLFYLSSPTLHYTLEISSRLLHHSWVHLICFPSVTVFHAWWSVPSKLFHLSCPVLFVSGGKVILVDINIYYLRNLWPKWW